MRLITITLLVLAGAGKTFAMSYQWPVLTGITVEITGTNKANYHTSWSTMKVEKPDWPESITILEAYNRETGRNAEGDIRSILAHRHLDKKGDSPTTGSDSEKTTSGKKKTLAEHAKNVMAVTTVKIVSHKGTLEGGECVGILTGPKAIVDFKKDWATALANSWDGGVGAAGSCIGVPPANQWCALTTPQVTFNYPVMQLENASGSEQESSVGVECTTGMAYTLRLQGMNAIQLSNGMSANLTVDDKKLGEAIQGKNGSNNLTLISQLAGSPTKSGPFSGTGVLFISYP